MKIRILMLVALLAMSGQASATYFTGSQLLKLCESTNQSERYICTGYLMGISDATRTYENWNSLNSKKFCMPFEVDSIQLQKVFIRHVNGHPEKLHLVASSLALNAFIEAFPCN